MGKTVHNDVLDALLAKITTANQMTVCSTEPTTRTEAITTYRLATETMATGDYTYADGDSSGRKITVAQQADLTVTATGTAQHIALVDSSDLLLVTTCTNQDLTATGNTVTVPEWDAEVSDPT